MLHFFIKGTHMFTIRAICCIINFDEGYSKPIVNNIPIPGVDPIPYEHNDVICEQDRDRQKEIEAIRKHVTNQNFSLDRGIYLYDMKMTFSDGLSIIKGKQFNICNCPWMVYGKDTTNGNMIDIENITRKFTEKEIEDCNKNNVSYDSFCNKFDVRPEDIDVKIKSEYSFINNIFSFKKVKKTVNIVKTDRYYISKNLFDMSKWKYMEYNLIGTNVTLHGFKEIK